MSSPNRYLLIVESMQKTHKLSGVAVKSELLTVNLNRGVTEGTSKLR
jgi:hypothetical protein